MIAFASSLDQAGTFTLTAEDAALLMSAMAGFDPRAKGFFWLAGQGGYGVQTAPAMAALVRYLVTGSIPDGDFSAVLEYVDDVAPQRLLK